MSIILHKQIAPKLDIINAIKSHFGIGTTEALNLYKNLGTTVDDNYWFLCEYYEHTTIPEPACLYHFEPWPTDNQINDAKAFYEGLSEEHKQHVDILIRINSIGGPIG